MYLRPFLLLALLQACSGPISLDGNSASANAEAQRRQKNVVAVRQQLAAYSDRGRFLLFRSRVPDSFEPLVFDYLSKVGATMVTRGHAEFEIDMDYERHNRCPGIFHRKGEIWLRVAVKIYDLQGLGGTKSLIFVGESSGCSHRDSRDEELRHLLDHALHNMNF